MATAALVRFLEFETCWRCGCHPQITVSVVGLDRALVVGTWYCLDVRVGMRLDAYCSASFHLQLDLYAVALPKRLLEDEEEYESTVV